MEESAFYDRCPVIEWIKGHIVVLQVPPTCEATEDLKLLYKVKEDKDWKSQHVQQSKDTVTLTDLSPDTQYDVKYTAVGKLNYTIDSDVIHIIVIDKKLISATESVLESLTLTEKRCSELMDDSRSKIFSAFNRKIQDMMKHCQTYRQDLITRIQSLINSIQACEKGICDLKDLLQAHEESPFKVTSLTDWITIKEKELNVVTKILQKLLDSGAEEHNNLDEILSDINVENVLCYTFSSLEEPDELLSHHENYLKHQMMRRDLEKMPDVSKTWLQGAVREKMREHLKIFKDIMTSHGSRSTKFLVSSKDHTIHPGSCILLYENGSHEALFFTPPSKLACPNIIQVKGYSVVLNVPPTCQATEDLRLMYKIKEDKDWKSQHEQQSKDTVTLTDLSPDTEYEIKYTAVGKLNYTIDSDVIHIRVIDKKLISATESVFESLTLTEKRCSELMDDSRSKIFIALNRKIEDMMKHCQTYRQDLSTRIQSLIHSIQACEKGICDLEDILQAHEESPFKDTSLIEWITIKEKELNGVTKILQQLLDSGAEEHNNLDEILLDINVENVLCYTFSSLEEPDELLSNQEHDLRHQMIRRDLEKMPDAVSRTWLQGTVREKMREHIKIFKEIMTSHDSQSTKFLVSSTDHRIHPGSCILLYENGSHEALCFTPPSKPACPNIKQVRGHGIVFKMPSSCPVPVEQKLLYDMKEEREWKSQHVHKSQETVTLEDLSPDTEHDVKYTAVGKLNYTTDSDAIKVEGEKKGVKVCRWQDAQPMRFSIVKYFVTLPGYRQKYHIDSLDALHRETPGLVKVSSVQESDVILHFHSESHAALKDYKRKDEFQLIVPQNVQVKLGSDVTIPCHLSPEISAVDMEIRWFKETDCVILYKNGQVTELRSYEGRVNLVIHELDRGNVSLILRELRESDAGVYLCQVTSQDTTVEETVQVNECGVKLFSMLTGKTNNSHKSFVDSLMNRVEDLREVPTVDESDIVLVFCPIVSRAGTDIEAALKILTDSTEDVKVCIITSGKTKETQIQFFNTLSDRIKSLKEVPTVNESHVVWVFCPVVSRAGTDIEAALKIFDDSTEDVKVCIITSGKTKETHITFFNILSDRIKSLKEVPTLGESHVVMVFCPVVSQAGTDIEAALKIFDDSTEIVPDRL
ncbi:hypothetical protein E1301_Tti018945 [Triplophysa tibetana]|uniref:Ig-like domain-containing protein n=1 Tax=Triplophysa tibetana TaxID=1572043 RepID=A0A5A9P441_9TELE|nr:hypothetical protein E1301_Tti018945 [Triplophysa tibetana]